MHYLLRNTIKPAFLAPVLLATTLFSYSSAQAASAQVESKMQPDTQPVDLVLALDVSNSMSGLIDSAKQRLWDVVNEFNQAQPQPDLRVSVISYGNPTYGQSTGYVRIDQPLTRDLDAVNQALFGFRTKGGNEYVARVITRAVDELQWSSEQNALRVLFIAGNESATQDPQFNLRSVVTAASNKGIVVNTIFCGQDGNGHVPAGWRSVAQNAGGMYASIDQNKSAIANIMAPQDKRLRELNAELNKTYVPFGDAGGKRRENQLRQDKNAASMSEQAVAARAVTKASKAYRASEWDLVDAIKSGTKLEEVEPQALPAPMRAMDKAKRQAYVQKKAEERESLRSEIAQLGAARAKHIAQQRAKLAGDETTGLADAMKQGLRTIAEKKGFTFKQ